MNAKELRIGNLVLWEEEFREVGSISQNNEVGLRGKLGGMDGCSIASIEPIPLTKEWLVKFGFEKKVKNTGAPIWENLESFSLDGYEFSEDSHGEWFLCGYNWNTKHFKYVHQLQNLYFSLTGEELTLNK